MVFRSSNLVSQSLDVPAKPRELVPWRPEALDERSSSPGPPFLTLYSNKPVPVYQTREYLHPNSSAIRIPSLNYLDRMPACPGAPKLGLIPLPPCKCCDGEHKPRHRIRNEKETRILAWLENVEPVNHGPWVSFLPTCESSNGSDISLESIKYKPDSVKCFPIVEPEPTSFIPIFEEGEDKESSDGMDGWPYDGRGLYEHHSRHECGLACYVACRQRRTFRAGLGKVLTKVLPWTREKREPTAMSNSDVPHPPWWLSYRSNDDTLGEDEDDGDLELWLEHTTQKQLLNHELRFQLSLNQKPDSRIFSSWSEQSF